MSGRGKRHVAIAASITCYAAALCLPVLDDNTIGLHCLLFGWIAIPWLANPMWLVSVLLLGARRYRAAVWTGAAGVGLSLLTLLYYPLGWLALPGWSFFEPFGYQPWVIKALGPGFYAWSAALWIPTLAAVNLWRDAKQGEAAQTAPVPF